MRGVRDHLKVPRSAEDDKRAMERVLLLMKANPSLGRVASDELEILGLLIERCENERSPIVRLIRSRPSSVAWTSKLSCKEI